VPGNISFPARSLSGIAAGPRQAASLSGAAGLRSRHTLSLQCAFLRPLGARVAQRRRRPQPGAKAGQEGDHGAL